MPPSLEQREGKRQRFYARNAVNTTLLRAPARLMQSFLADQPANPLRSGKIHPALMSFADELCAAVARLFAYVGVLALFGILGLQGLGRLQQEFAAEPAPEAGWSLADHSFPGVCPQSPGSVG
jgi:hypothetical protein